MIDPKTWKVVYHGPIDDRFAGKTAKPNAKVKKAYVVRRGEQPPRRPGR